MLSNEMKAVRFMHEQFGINKHVSSIRELSPEEREFRITCMKEEVNEYEDAKGDIAEELDALVDAMVFIIGTAELQGFLKGKLPALPEAFARVMHANCQKELAVTDSKSKRGYGMDLVKPVWWQAPYLQDLVQVEPSKYRGLIILEGPDGVGKSTLAQALCDKYQGHYFHATWTKELEPYMDKYIGEIMHNALRVAEHRVAIVDRCWVSEYIYDAVYRQRSDFEDFYNRMDALCRSAVKVRCLPKSRKKYLSAYEELLKQREEMYNEKIDVLYDTYQTFFFSDPRNLSVAQKPFKNTRYLCSHTYRGRNSPTFDYMEYRSQKALNAYIKEWIQPNLFENK